MKRSSIVLTVVAGLLVFAIILGLNLPASWFAGFLPPQVRCNGLGGTVWHGECLGLQYQGAALGDAYWNLAPGAALTGRLSGDVSVQGNALQLSGELDTNLRGIGEFRNVAANLRMDPALLPFVPREQNGTLVAQLERFELGRQGSPTAIKGTIELRDFRQLAPQPMALGSYVVTFDGQPSADGSLTGKVNDLGGPFIVDATLQLSPSRSYLVQGYIIGRTAQAESLVREITLGAMPDASGRSTFSFEGTY